VSTQRKLTKREGEIRRARLIIGLHGAQSRLAATAMRSALSSLESAGSITGISDDDSTPVEGSVEEHDAAGDVSSLRSSIAKIIVEEEKLEKKASTKELAEQLGDLEIRCDSKLKYKWTSPPRTPQSSIQQQPPVAMLVANDAIRGAASAPVIGEDDRCCGQERHSNGAECYF